MSTSGAMRPNPGRCPVEARGKRVRGLLANGRRFGFERASDTGPLGWPADGPGACCWSLTGFPFDIARYEVIP